MLEPLNDVDQAAARYEADGDASAQLLALLLKHHPEHEQPIGGPPKRLIHPRKTP